MSTRTRTRNRPGSSLILGALLTAFGFGFGGPAGAASEAPPKPADRVAPAALARSIDESIEARLSSQKLAPGPRADDAEFLRRLYLDLTGIIPPPGDVVAFLDSRDPAKRAKAIDALLASPRFARHQAETWESLLMIRDSTNRRLKSEPLVEWLDQQFAKDRPWDELVRDLLTVTGTQEENGAATFFIALRTPDKLNDQVCKLFLGVNLQCAQCHNHPFAPWKRDDYWSMAAFFSKVRAGGKKVGIAKNGTEEVSESGKGKKAPLPDSAVNLAPRFLGGERPELPEKGPYRPVLAQWLTAPENPYFARAMVNRTWARFFARGLVEPVDNINDFASASHPELFEALTRQFIASGFDLKHLIRGICNSQTYQRASGPASEESLADGLFARMTIKPLSPEQLYDSLASILGTKAEGTKPGRKAAKQAGANKNPLNSPRARFIAFFDVPDGTDPTEYATGIPQVLKLMNAPEMNAGADLLDQAFESSRTPLQALDQLYLATLARHPSKAERARVETFLKASNREPREEFDDLLWVLLNTSEFALNH